MNNKKKYEGLGFVELIIAIGVAGIAVIVLMSMATNSMKESVRLERQDALTRLAQDGALVVRKHVEDVNSPTYEGPPFIGDVNHCYAINRTEDSAEDSGVDFSHFIELGSITLEDVDEKLKENEEFHVDIIYDWISTESFISDVYYFAYCVSAVEETSTDLKTYVGSVIAGYVYCSNCNISPYEHPIIVNVRE